MMANENVTGHLELIKSDHPDVIRRIDLKGNQITVGRGVQNSIVWENLLQISRRHALLEFSPELHTWRLMDMSTNGLLINGRKIPKEVLVELNDQDIIAFIPTGALQYKFFKVNSNSVPKTPHPVINIDTSVSSSADSPIFVSPSPISTPTTSSVSPPKRKTYPESTDLNSESNERDRKRKRLQLNVVSNQISSSIKEEEEEEEEHEELADIDEVPLYFHDSSVFSLNETDYKHEQQDLLYSDNENEGNDDLQAVKDKLKDCQTRIKELEKHNKKLTDEKQDAIETLQKKISTVKSESLVFQEELIKKLLEVLEHEFSCCICNEVFIQATVVDCGHTFCGHCISEWVKRKSECPNCRKGIQMQVKHTEMENFITKLHSLLSEETRKKRQDAVAERNREVEAAKTAQAAAAATTTTTNRNSRGRGIGNLSDFPFAPDRFVDFLAELQMFVPNATRRATHLGNIPPPPPPAPNGVERPDDLPFFHVSPNFRHDTLLRARAAAAAHQNASSSRRRSARIHTARHGPHHQPQQQQPPPNQPVQPQNIPDLVHRMPDYVLGVPRIRDILTVD